jgi:hypothetical protein
VRPTSRPHRINGLSLKLGLFDDRQFTDHPGAADSQNHKMNPGSFGGEPQVMFPVRELLFV